MKNYLASIGEAIRSLRITRKMTQSELGEILGISTRHLQNIEYGKTNLTISHILDFAKAFDVEPSSFFHRSIPNHNVLTSLDFLPVGIMLCNYRGLVLYMNQVCVQFHQLNRNDVCNKMHIWELLTEKIEEKEFRSYLNYLVKEQPTPRPYFAISKSRQGTNLNIRIDWSYIYDKKDKVIGFNSTILYR